VLVGDAAHHTNPLTGGGISAAMRAGRHAAQVIGEGLRSNNLSSEFLNKYESLVEADFGKSHQKQLKFRRFLLEQNKKDQVDTYHVLNAALGKDGKKLDLLTHPLRTLKVISAYRKFK
jgi:digeranylgeranylglycerophospholipid reductase